MATVTVNTCDRCKLNDYTSSIKLHKIEIKVQINSYFSDKYTPKGLSATWCTNCCVQTGLIKVSPDGRIQTAEPTISLEDIIRDIVQSEIEEY